MRFHAKTLVEIGPVLSSEADANRQSEALAQCGEEDVSLEDCLKSSIFDCDKSQICDCNCKAYLLTKSKSKS